MDEGQAALSVLCRLFAAPARAVSARALGPARTRDLLAGWGAIREDGMVSVTACDACDELHMAEVSRTPDGRVGWRCPEAGFVEAPIDQLRRWRIDREGIARALAAGFTRRGTFDAGLDPGVVWRLGRREWRGRDVELLLASDPPDAPALARWRRVALALSPMGPGAILTAAGIPEDLDVAPGWKASALDPLLVLGPEGHPEIDEDRLDAMLARWHPATTPAVPGRPSTLAGVEAVLEHCRRVGVVPGDAAPRPAVVRKHWEEVFPNSHPPATSTIKGHLAAIRARRS